ncbi:MAG TPA: DUF1761 domain-containing protein [Pseudomonadota bacterium]|jgi:hypothetical protein|nr:DUF1761 domain-containing protein [Pseudomonadota bacterium]
MPEVNLLAVAAAALSSFLLGGLWYSPVLFGKTWQVEAKAPDQAGHPAKVFGGAFLFSLLAAYAFAALLGPRPDLHRAIHMGAMTGFCFVAAGFGINYLFAQRSLKLWLIDGGYHTLQFVLYGLVLGVWH